MNTLYYVVCNLITSCLDVTVYDKSIQNIFLSYFICNRNIKHYSVGIGM